MCRTVIRIKNLIGLKIGQFFLMQNRIWVKLCLNNYDRMQAKNLNDLKNRPVYLMQYIPS